MKRYLNSFYFKIILAVIILFILSFIVFYDTNDLFKLPFNAGTWGTFSDWVMISVTLATAYWLVRTFHEQKRANDILDNKSKREVMPVFTVSKFAKPHQGSINAIFIEITLTYNTAYSPNILRNEFMGNATFPNRQVDIGEVLSISVDRDHISKSASKELVLSIYFSDIDGRKYVQIVWLENLEFIIDWPHHLSGSEDLSFFQELETFIKSVFKRKVKKKNLPF